MAVTYERGNPVTPKPPTPSRCGRGGGGAVRGAKMILWVQGYLAHKKLPPPQDFRRALGIGLLQGPWRRQFLMSEVPLYLGSKGT